MMMMEDSKMPKFVVYEIWTKSRIVEAATIGQAYDKGEPKARKGLNLSNWHIQKIGKPKLSLKAYSR